MSFRKRKRNRFKFTEKTHSKRAMAALGVSGSSLLMYLIFLYVAFRSAGKVNVYFGCFGILFAFVDIIGAVLAVQSLFEEDSFKHFPIAASFTALLTMVLWVGTYLEGIM